MLFPVLSKTRRPVSIFDVMSQFDEALRPINSEFASVCRQEEFHPSVDIEQKDGVWFVTADLPGMRKEDVKVEYSDGVLTLSGERNKESRGEGKYLERVYGRFTRSFKLPTPVDVDKIQAKYENGVLSLELPMAEAARAKAIEIK